MTTNFKGTPGATYSTRGRAFTADNFGLVSVSNPTGFELLDLYNENLIQLGSGGGLNNLSATTDPLVTHDNTVDYAVGSVWVNTTANRTYVCTSSATGAAVWVLASQNPNNFRNLIDGGDFQTNPWQRGTSITGITNSVTYGPDRFFAIGGASSSISLVKTANTDIAGFTQACAFGRASSNTDTTAINFGQVLESLDCYRCQGQQVTLSFWAKAGANYSGGAVTVKLYSGTAADGSAANMVTGSWTGSATPINSTFTPTTTMTRYQFTGTVAAAALQLGVLLTYTPSGTAGANDNILFHGVQLEVGGDASAFEFRDAEVELALAQRYYFQLNEANGANIATGAPTTANNQAYSIWLPTPMRVAPTTVSVTAGGIKAFVDGGGASTPTGLAAGSAHSNSIISLVSTITMTAAAHSIILQGSGSTGKITASADY